ncbi:MAG TPA: hypothetical protein DDY57_01310 [Franconibacter pulveris]|nr:hypothetical protein [Franconibacter pulveris]
MKKGCPGILFYFARGVTAAYRAVCTLFHWINPLAARMRVVNLFMWENALGRHAVCPLVR